MSRNSRALHKIALAAGASLLLLTPLVAEDALTLDQILAKNYEARGGVDQLRALKSMRTTGTLAMQGMVMPMTIEAKSEQFRLEISVQGNSIVQVIDVDSGWMINPMMGSSEPQKMPDDMLNAMSDQTDLSGPLVDWQEKGHTVELIGREEVAGTDAYHLRITLKSGNVTDLYLDAEHFIEFQSVGKRTINGQELENTTTLGDYKEVDGLMVAHSIEVKTAGIPASQSMTLEKIELNVDIAADRFTMPEPTPAATGTDG